MNDPGQWDFLQNGTVTPSPFERTREGEEKEIRRQSIRRKPVAYPVLIDAHPTPNRTRPAIGSTTEESVWDGRAVHDLDYVYDGRPN
jgi:hypothetical protein